MSTRTQPLFADGWYSQDEVQVYELRQEIQRLYALVYELLERLDDNVVTYPDTEDSNA